MKKLFLLVLLSICTFAIGQSQRLELSVKYVGQYTNEQYTEYDNFIYESIVFTSGRVSIGNDSFWIVKQSEENGCYHTFSTGIDVDLEINLIICDNNTGFVSDRDDEVFILFRILDYDSE